MPETPAYCPVCPSHLIILNDEFEDVDLLSPTETENLKIELLQAQVHHLSHISASLNRIAFQMKQQQ